jgi:isopenicillin-N epimerase
VELVELKVDLPIADMSMFLSGISNALTDNIRLAVFDFITSPTAFVLPIEQIIQVCHDKGIPVLIDGAHAPGQVMT